MDRIWVLIGKEWQETLRNKVTMLTMIVPSLLFVLLPLALIFLTKAGGPLEQMFGIEQISPDDMKMLQNILPQFSDLSSSEFAQALSLSSMQAMFLIIPLLVPMIIATYSVIGEKQNRSLEPLLVTPIETWELLVGKALAAAVPGFLLSWFSYLILAVLAPFGMSERLYTALIVRPSWLVALLLLAPLLAFLAVTLALIVSSRAQDPQSAQQLAGLVVLPVVALMIGQLSGVVQLSVPFVLVTALIVAAINLALIWVAVRLFQRETILMRWK